MLRWLSFAPIAELPERSVLFVVYVDATMFEMLASNSY